MSLATRISLVTGLAVALVGASGGIAFYLAMRQLLRNEIDESVNERMAWIESSVEVDSKDIEFDAPFPRPGMSGNWSVALQDGRPLWSSGKERPTQGDVVLTKTLDFGNHNNPPVASADVRVKGPEDEDPDDTDDKSNGEWGSTEDPVAYKWPGKKNRLKLTLTAWAPGGQMRSGLTRLTVMLGTVGPAILVLLIAAITLLVRWQLRHLHTMAGEAASVGPANLDARISTSASCTEYVALSGALNTMIARLAEGLERERRFASAAAHELRTPLAQMHTGLEVLLRRPRPAEEYRSAVADQLKDVERLEKLIAGLLWISKASNGKILAGSPVNLAVVVEKAEAQCGAILVKDRPELDQLRVQGDEELLVAVISNVVDNAGKYAQGQVPEMEVRAGKERVEIMVRDSGPGIAPADRERIFEPLVRLDEARTVGGARDGLGLGLSVARAILNALGGEISCRDRADGKAGAEFLLDLKRYVDSSRRAGPVEA